MGTPLATAVPPGYLRVDDLGGEEPDSSIEDGLKRNSSALGVCPLSFLVLSEADAVAGLAGHGVGRRPEDSFTVSRQRVVSHFGPDVRHLGCGEAARRTAGG